MFREPSAELRLLLWSQDELSLTLVIGEAFPKRHGQLYPVLGGQFDAGMSSLSVESKQASTVKHGRNLDDVIIQAVQARR